jgi:L-2-hydroxyglutarate oxidase LhgO
MYKLVVRWIDKSVMERMVTPDQLKRYIPLMKGGVVHATLTTPSGVVKEITQYFNQ